MDIQSPHLDIPFRRACDEVLLLWIHSQTSDWYIMGLEGVPELSLTDVKYTDLPLPTPRDQELVMGGIHNGWTTMFMTDERMHTGTPWG